MSAKVKVTRAYINELKRERDIFKKELEKVKVDRAKHRRFYIKLLKETLDSLSRNEGLNSNWLSQELAKHMTNCEPWTWGWE